MRHAWLVVLLLLQVAPKEGWREEEVGDGVTWRFRRFDDLFGARQSVGILEADLARAENRIAFVAAERGLEKTSAIAGRTRAVAAVNGGYFRKDGAPDGILKIDGQVLGRAIEGRGAVGIDARGEFHWKRLTKGDSWEAMTHALGGVPILVEEGKIADMEREPAKHLKVRHPRTAIGITAKRKLVLVVVDGRAPEAAGMTCEELARLMVDLGCSWALNLDGGGSSAMWVRGKPHDGIVSNPCDDGKYDPAGERRVANAVVVLARDVIELRDPGARVTARIEFEGEYEILARWKEGAGGRARVTAGGKSRDVAVEPAKDAWTSLGRFLLPAGDGHSVELGEPLPAGVKYVQRN
jgi:hypothetical protein